MMMTKFHGPYDCDYCKYRSPWPQNVKRHEETQHFGTLRKICRRKTKKMLKKKMDERSKLEVGTLRISSADILVSPDGKFHCKDCDYESNKKRLLKSHMRRHSDERPFPCTFPGCAHRSKFSHKAMAHERTVHSFTRPKSSRQVKPKATKKAFNAVQVSKKLQSPNAPGVNSSSRQVKGGNKATIMTRGMAKLVVDQPEPEVDKELNLVDDDDESGKENNEEGSMEAVVELADSTGFACLLCAFVGYSERAALDHAKSHTRPPFPIDKLKEIPVVCLD